MRDTEFFFRHYAPTTTQMAFFKMAIDDLGDRLLEREKWVNQKAQLPWTVTRHDANGSLSSKLHKLLPLTSVLPTKILTSHTKSEWSVYIPNGWKGGDVSSQPPYLGDLWGVEVLIVTMVRDVLGGQPGSTQFVMQTTGNSPRIERSRVIAAHKESRWEFHEHGQRFPFEEVDRYESKRIKDRLTPEMIERYCAHLGINLFDPDFYFGKGYVINTYLPPNTQFYPNFPNQKVSDA